jgi:hypothetical protein
MKKILSIIVISFTLVLSSCSEWLNTTPYTSTLEEEAIRDLADAQVALNGVYVLIRTASFYGCEAIACGDAGTPDVVLKVPNSNRYTNVYPWNNLQPDGSHYTDIYARGYRAIDAVNKLIQKTEAFAITDEDEDTKDQILGEAYLLRAMIHFEILKYFAQAYNYTGDGSHLGIVYMLEPTKESDHPRLTAKQSFEHIIADAEKSITLMKVIAPSRPFTLGKLAADALLARVYLYKACKDGTDDFAKAKTHSENVINSGIYALATPSQYRITGDDENLPFASALWLPAAGFSNESIFTLPFYESERLYTTYLGKMYLDTDKGYGDLLPSDEIVALIGNNSRDVRNTIFYEHAYSGNAIVCMRKFFGPVDNWDLGNLNIFRISEMYLIAAEAAARIGGATNETLALGYLNNLKENRDLASVNFSGQALVDEILLERRKELCFEGHRLADLKRLNIGVIRGTDSNNVGNQRYGVAYPDYRFAYPIPQHEMNANKLMEQNPGY